MNKFELAGVLFIGGAGIFMGCLNNDAVTHRFLNNFGIGAGAAAAIFGAMLGLIGYLDGKTR